MTQSEIPLFSRVVETRRTSSWRAAAPAVLVLVAAVVLIAYLASKVSSYSQQAAMAQQDATATRQQLEATQKQSGTMQNDLAVARSAGRTTVLLEASAAKGKKAPATKSWAAATWGEADGGKSWVRLMAYGLAPAPEGKEYRAWMQPASGDPVDAGRIEPAQDGTAFAMAQNLPAIDQGKRLIVALEDENAKAPGETLMAADLPKLQATRSAAAAPAAPASDAAATPEAGQKAGGTKSPADATK